MPKKKIPCSKCEKLCSSETSPPVCQSCKGSRTKTREELRMYQRGHTLKSKYGIDNVDFECLWQAFKGKCGICERDLVMPLSSQGQPRNVAVIDHDHKTGNIRGILCNSCNKAIGLLEDSPDLCIKASVWLNYSRN